MYYFAYGSNMSRRRLLERIPAVRVGVAELPGYRLAFTKPGEQDGSAKCDILPGKTPEDSVYGVLYEILREHRSILDGYEGVGVSYRLEMVNVVFNGKELPAATYIALGRDDRLKPYHWYKEHVLRGAEENGLPPAYIDMIRAVESLHDPDEERTARETSIYI